MLHTSFGGFSSGLHRTDLVSTVKWKSREPSDARRVAELVNFSQRDHFGDRVIAIVIRLKPIPTIPLRNLPLMTKPNITFDFETIEMAFEFANFDDRSNDAYLDRRTGKSLYFSMLEDSEDEPDDLDDRTRYVAIPDTRDFGLGSQLAVQFATENAPELLDDVHSAFTGRGAFRRFKDLLDRSGFLEAWYQYQAEYERK